jgi:hypothetical protein
MEATYIGIHMWKQAVEKAKSTDTDKVIAAMAGQTFKAPGGFTSKMDEKNHHLHKPVFIGEIKADGQFNVVWKTKGPVRPSRGARSSPATTRRRTRRKARAIDPALLKPLASEDSDTKIAAIAALAQAAPEEALPVLKALADNSLALAGERLVIVDGERVLRCREQ